MGYIGFVPLVTFISLEVSILLLAPTVFDCGERAERQVPPPVRGVTPHYYFSCGYQ